MFTDEHVKIIKNGGIGIIPTDTLYGIVASTDNRDVLVRLENLRGIKGDRRGYVVLIAGIADLDKFEIRISEDMKTILEDVWPGPFSIEFASNPGMAFRIPDKNDLREFLEKTGPIYAPSANLTNEKPAKDIETAREYFGDNVDFYVDAGDLESLPSTVLFTEENRIKVIREGKGDIFLFNQDNIDIIK